MDELINERGAAGDTTETKLASRSGSIAKSY